MSTIPSLKTRGKNYTGLGATDKQAAGTGREVSFFSYIVLLQGTTSSGSAWLRMQKPSSPSFPRLFASQPAAQHQARCSVGR